jgi:malonyl-CoA/methylmalonyl-CoA synthetase
VVTTHRNIAAQIRSLVEAWDWTCNDRILHVLPLHHIHGIINVLSCALWSGACCEFLPRFDAMAVWDRIASGQLSLFMAVPTIYARLISAWEAASVEQQQAWSAGANELRLMVSGSAALPVSTLERWEELSGHTLLERYGMTEIGMALSNPLHGRRRPGHVGAPLPSVETCLADESGNAPEAGTPGEIWVRGDTVFSEYWRKPEATAAAFAEGGWFRTGDVAVIEDGSYRILGRNSVDIIKTGGYKVSALEIEEVLRTHPAIAECAVIGLPDKEWGEVVACCIVPHAAAAGEALSIETLRAWAKEHLAVYKVPQRLLVSPDLPRNALGKVQKPAVLERFQSP